MIGYPPSDESKPAYATAPRMQLMQAAPAIRIRWRMFGFLFGFGLLAYVQQKTITVAADQMMPQLGLSQEQIGWLEDAFVWGYALFQIPGGVFGQRIGARRTFVIISLIAFLATVGTPLVPAFFAGHGVFVALVGAQLLLGCAQGAIFPVSAGVFEAWFPPRHWALVQGLQTMGLQLGAAATPPLIASLMLAFGWQRALTWASLPAVALIAAWGWYGRNSPRTHPAMTAAELAEIEPVPGGEHAPATDAAINWRTLGRLLGNRSVLSLAVSYLCMNYTFFLLSNWVFLYLRQERHFSSLEGGWLAIAPPLAAAFGAGIGGALTGLACRRLGVRWGFRFLPLAALPAAALLLLLAVNAGNAYVAVAALSASFGCIEVTEGSYWGAGMSVGRGDTMAVCGIMNTGGNLGGIIGIPIVAHFSGLQQWTIAFWIGAGLALVAAAAWLWIDIDPAAAEMPVPDLAP